MAKDTRPMSAYSTTTMNNARVLIEEALDIDGDVFEILQGHETRKCGRDLHTFPGVEACGT